MSFLGARVLALESRRADETAELIRRNGGEPFVAPSMREVPLEDNHEALAFLDHLRAGDFDMVIFLTGVGARLLFRIAATRMPTEQLVEALRRTTTVARGPKPVAALREIGLTPSISVPEPNTWREILQAIEGHPARRIAVQEYGRPNPDLIRELEKRGAEVTAVPVYQWQLPEDLAPLKEAARRIEQGEADVILFTSSAQLDHLFSIAPDPQALLRGLQRLMIASIGPTTTETLRRYGLEPTLEPSHPKLGILVREAAEAWSRRRPAPAHES